MAKLSILRRYRSLDARQRKLLAEAFAALAASSAAIRFLPFRRVVAAAAKPPAAGKPAEWSETETMQQVRWAVKKVAGIVPWRTVCFQKGLAAHTMLRRRGLPSVLHYGVQRVPEGNIRAHVWVCMNGRDVVGGEEAPGFTCVATYPPAA